MHPSIHLILISLCVAAASESESSGSSEEEMDERFAQLKKQLLRAVQHSNSTNTEEELLPALIDLANYVGHGRCAYDSKLAQTLEALLENGSEEVYQLALSILECFPYGVEGKLTCYPDIH